MPGTPADMVVSDCILSQIISTLTRLELTQAQMVSLTLAMRNQHMRQLVAALNPAGRAILITDLVSSDTLPELPGLSVAEWLPALQRCLQTGNFFTGLNPEMLSITLRTDAYLRERVTHQRFIAPWRWDISDKRSYLVYAILIEVAS